MKKLTKTTCFLSALILCLGLCGCNSDEKSSSKVESVVETTEQETTEAVTEKPTETKIMTYTDSPYNIYAYFKENNNNIGKYIEYNKDTDPNKLLGTDGSYLQKLNFSLTNLPDNIAYSPDLGVSIEIYKDFTDAENRKKSFESLDTLNFSSFISENILMRITTEADDDTVTSLQNSLTEFMKTPKDYKKNQTALKDDEVHPFADPENYKSICKSVSYSDIARDSNGLKGQYFKFTGEVIQVLDGTYRMNVTVNDYGFYSDTIMFIYDTGSGDRILEKDIVTIWGTSQGLLTYTSVLGADITVPSISARYVTINAEE